MAVLESTMFGALEYEPSQLIVLTAPLRGLPGTSRLLPVSQQVIAPFVFFQSVENAKVCLLATPVRVVKEDFQTELSAEDRQMLRLTSTGEPDTGGNSGGRPIKSHAGPPPDLGIFAFVSVAEDQKVTANLLAPLVIHFAENLAVQAIQPLDESFLRFPMNIVAAGGSPC